MAHPYDYEVTFLRDVPFWTGKSEDDPEGDVLDRWRLGVKVESSGGSLGSYWSAPEPLEIEPIEAVLLSEESDILGPFDLKTLSADEDRRLMDALYERVTSIGPDDDLSER